MRLQSEYNTNSYHLSMGPNVTFEDERFSLDHDVESGSYQLNIRDVKRSDEGKYQCQVNTFFNFLLTKSQTDQLSMLFLLKAVSDVGNIVYSDVNIIVHDACDVGYFSIGAQR